MDDNFPPRQRDFGFAYVSLPRQEILPHPRTSKEQKMKTFDQQVLHTQTTNGDCTRAVVYTLAQKDLDLPHPIGEDKNWNIEFFEALETKGYDFSYYPREKSHWPRYVGRSGISPRGTRHLVVWDREQNTIFHDPHPSREGITDYDGWFILTPIRD